MTGGNKIATILLKVIGAGLKGVGAEVEVVVEAQFMALGGNRDSLR